MPPSAGLASYQATLPGSPPQRMSAAGSLPPADERRRKSPPSGCALPEVSPPVDERGRKSLLQRMRAANLWACAGVVALRWAEEAPRITEGSIEAVPQQMALCLRGAALGRWRGCVRMAGESDTCAGFLNVYENLNCAPWRNCESQYLGHKSARPEM